jgi:hypothetical protein
MQCEEFEDRLNEVLDQRQRPEWDAPLRLHGDTCAACRDLAASYGLLLDGFYALATPEPPANLPVRVLDECRSRRWPARRAAFAAGALATAAAAWFVVVPLVQTDSPRQVSRAPFVVESPSSAKPPLAWNEVDSLPVVGPVLGSISDDDDSTDPYAELVKGTGQGLASVVLYMPTIGGSPAMIGGAPNPVTGAPAWPERMSDGLKPVTEVVGETLDLLLRVLPLSDDSASRS